MNDLERIGIYFEHLCWTQIKDTDPVDA